MRDLDSGDRGGGGGRVGPCGRRSGGGGAGAACDYLARRHPTGNPVQEGRSSSWRSKPSSRMST